MCGIIGLFELKTEQETLRKQALTMAAKIRHRGPDWSGIYADKHAILVHERLSIVDVEHGAQPLIDMKTGRVLIVNGEIYNHKELQESLKKEHDWQTASDCEVILYLYDEFGPACVDMLSGIFAFILYDPKAGEYLVARDHIGIIPLYTGKDKLGQFYVASEMKSLDGFCETIDAFPPGQYYLGSKQEYVQWYDKPWMHETPKEPVSLERIRTSMEAGVKQQLMSDVPYGVLISGGLDSSLIAAIAAKYRKKRVETKDQEEAWWPRLHSFSVGLEGSPDMKYARIVADHLGTVHHEVLFTIQEGLDAIEDVIYHLDTFDPGSIRAATPMYLMSRKIKAMGIKMVLSGEGADELFGGYLYFHKAPSVEEFHKETVRKLTRLHQFDCKRANKSAAAWGVEVRVPFLDKEFIETAMSFDPKDKLCDAHRCEKGILRKAFEGYLPEEVLWRQKEQLPDGVGYGWIDGLKDHAEKLVADEDFAKASERYPEKTPLTKEEFLYRQIFERKFSKAGIGTVPYGPSVACSTPEATAWSPEFQNRSDSSGRAIAGVHAETI